MNVDESLQVLAVDPRMANIIASVGEITLEPQNVPMFQSLVRSVIGQQLSRRAATAIFGRFVGLFPGESFPTAQQVHAVDIQKLAEAGLSKAKAAYVKGLSEADMDGSLPSLDACASLSDSEIIRLLTGIKGIGLWSAQMALIFNLARPDVLPSSDSGIRRSFGLMYLSGEVASPKRLETYAHRWQPCRTLASLYLWRALDTGLQ